MVFPKAALGAGCDNVDNPPRRLSLMIRHASFPESLEYVVC